MFRLLVQRSSLLILLISMASAALLGVLQSRLYAYVHRLDCGASSNRHHPACVEGPVLLVNGRIQGATPQGRVEALVVNKGRVLEHGTTEALTGRYPDALKVDLGGYFAMPGFEDRWVDLLNGGLSSATLDLEPAVDRQRCLEFLADYVRGHADQTWILGQGWSTAQIGQLALTRQELDSLSTEQAIFLWNADHTAAALNGRALKELGITRNTPEPQGGRIGRDHAGEPSGLLEGAAAEQAFSALVHRLSPSAFKRALLSAQQHLLEQGITRVASPVGQTPEVLTAIGELLEAGAWRLRVTAMPGAESAVRPFFRLYRSPDLETLHVGGVFLELDGPIKRKSAAFSVPLPDGTISPPLKWEPDALRSLLGREPEPPFLVANGDRALSVALAASSALPGTVIWSPLWPPQLLESAGSVVPGVSPASWREDWPRMRALIPSDFQQHSLPFRSLLTHSGRLVLASGWPRSTTAPLAHLEAVTSNVDPMGDSLLPEWHDPELLGLDEALLAMLQPQSEKGTPRLDVGMPADLVVLSAEPAAGGDLQSIHAVMTIVGGEVVYRREEQAAILRAPQDALDRSVSWTKVLIRQRFPSLVLVLAFLLWPVLVLLIWTIRHRPRPTPPRVLARLDS